MNGIIVIAGLIILLLHQLGRIDYTGGLTIKILEDELERRYKTENKHKLMRIKGLTIK